MEHIRGEYFLCAVLVIALTALYRRCCGLDKILDVCVFRDFLSSFCDSQARQFATLQHHFHKADPSTAIISPSSSSLSWLNFQSPFPPFTSSCASQLSSKLRWHNVTIQVVPGQPATFRAIPTPTLHFAVLRDGPVSPTISASRLILL